MYFLFFLSFFFLIKIKTKKKETMNMIIISFKNYLDDKIDSSYKENVWELKINI